MAVTNNQLNAFEAAIARNIAAGTILAGYDICFRVEDVADIAFWQKVLTPNTKNKKVKFFPFVRNGLNRITGKSYIMKHQSQANANYILCVDSDLDFILGKADFDSGHYILQTYTYSWENHHCWSKALQLTWVQWQKNVEFDFTAFLQALSTVIFDAFVLMITKKRLSHKGFTQDALCNCLDKVQGNQKDALLNNGAGILTNISDNIISKLANVEPETNDELQATINRLEQLGVNQYNCYLYMQGHSVFNLVNRIGKALLDESFEYQVLIPSFSVNNEYQELEKIKDDVTSLFPNN
ncbi:MAG: DUF4435 domain-containing protein [Prevotellaceae bacterium]|nr:DUF4435 domain-containing protein [Candidatus Faecinaster equi]